VKNDDELTEKERSQTAPGNTFEERGQYVGIIQIIKSIVIFHE
jgi:hypothetical protein